MLAGVVFCATIALAVGVQMSVMIRALQHINFTFFPLQMKN